MDAALVALPAEAKPDAYAAHLATCMSAACDDVFTPTSQLLTAVMDEPLTLARALLVQFASLLTTVAARDQAKSLANFALERIQPRRVSFEEQMAAIRENLCKLHEEDEEWSLAARALAGIDLDSGVRSVDETYKLATCVKIAMLYLEDDDAVSAETHVKRASFLLAARDTDGEANTDPRHKALELQYKVCYARVLDSKRRFLEAAMRYYELSQLPSGSGASDRQEDGKAASDVPRVDDAELMQALEAAVACAVLAAAGPQRSRVLATPYKDERTSRLASHAILERVHLGRFLQTDIVDAFAATLKPHQLAKAGDGSTVLSRSVVEHNIVAASMVYKCVALEELGALLGVEPRVAEKAAGNMIFERRLNANIDQAAGMLRFVHDDGDAKTSWDATIARVCAATSAIAAAIAE